MIDIFARAEMLIGQENLKKLAESHVAVFGVGGVGSYATECLARSGIGNISIFDNDVVDITNINRQIIALNSTIGRYKVDVMKKRVLDINPGINVYSNKCFYSKNNAESFDFSIYDYIVDAVDTVSSKIEIISNAINKKIKIISCMGTGNKMDPKKLKIDDIYNTSVCPLARIVRHELRKLNIPNLKVLYSQEKPIEIKYFRTGEIKKHIPGSIAFVPAAAGVIIASEVVRDLINNKN